MRSGATARDGREPSWSGPRRPDVTYRTDGRAATGPEFYFDGMAVGYFAGDDGLRSEGSYRYEPYRGPGHCEMQALLRAGGAPRYSYDDMGERVEFSVAGRPEYGMLDLRGFKCGPREPG